jgi:formylglycine-generating enzyme required for sulfatase activity
MDPWLDEEKLLPGQNWRLEIPKALDESDVIIICLSRNSVDKEGYVQKEIRFALDKALEMPEGRIFLIPARLEECEVPESLKSYHWVDLFEKNWGRKLMQSLNLRAANLPGVRQVKVTDESSPKLSKPESDSPKKGRPIERLLPPAELVGDGSVDIGGDAKGTTIITGDNNIIVQSSTGEYEAKPKEEKPVGQIGNLSNKPTRKKDQEKKPARKFDFRKIRTIGIILIALLFGGWGINYLIQNPPPTSEPTATVSVTPTGTATLKISQQLAATRTAFALTARAPTTTFTPVSISLPTPGVGSIMISEKDGMTMVFVPAGEFTMGSNLYSDEQPIHKVTLDSFWIDQIEVTNKMYALCEQAEACQPPSSTNSSTRNDYYGVSEFDDYPVIYVDLNKAKTYCAWAGRRLPTEAEWEKAARGTDGRTYPWGNDAPNNNLLNYNKNVGDTTEVGKYPAGASIYGALDMAGNVWEWVSSLYQSYPYSASDGREDLSATGSRVLRGGAWYDLNSGVRSATRLEFTPKSFGYFGFRCVISQ